MLKQIPAEVAAMIDLARAQGIIKGYKTLVDWERPGSTGWKPSSS